jgi:serine protease Do
MTIDHACLTNNEAKVVLNDGSVHAAKIRSKSTELGVVMLKIDPPMAAGEPRPLPFLHVPAATELWPGRVLVSVGNAFRLAEFSEKPSATMGVMVAKVPLNLRFGMQDFAFPGEVIVTDAPNNPGVYGGGLFTLDGHWVGMMGPMVEAKETNTQISLAYPTEKLRLFIAAATGDRSAASELQAAAAAELEARKPVAHGVLLFDSGLRRSPPAYVDRVEPDSPAAGIGLRTDDLIVRLNEFPVRSCADFHRIIKTMKPGEPVDVTFKRGDEVMKRVMTLVEAKQ